MKLRIVVEIDPPSAEHCAAVMAKACGMYGDFSTCKMFRKRVPFDGGKPLRLPECIVAEQQYHVRKSGDE